eukprot:jgi/Chrzof1/10513/Cz05g01170.t1
MQLDGLWLLWQLHLELYCKPVTTPSGPHDTCIFRTLQFQQLCSRLSCHQHATDDESVIDIHATRQAVPLLDIPLSTVDMLLTCFSCSSHRGQPSRIRDLLHLVL